MKSFSLSGVARQGFGKKATKATRAEGLIPCIVYSNGTEATHFSVTEADIRNLIYTPEIFVIDLTIDGKTCKAILKDIQFHPVSDKVLHIDFLQVTEDKEIVFEVPVKLNGLAEGVKQGGKLALEMRKLRVKALYTNLPEFFTIDVAHLGLGKTIQVGELAFDNCELVNAKNAVVCAVKLTRAARGMMAAAAKKGK
ncbi:MAG: 50S ribosomal protein L25/general stress protein Ctc [Bacteroidales bacterium]